MNRGLILVAVASISQRGRRKMCRTSGARDFLLGVFLKRYGTVDEVVAFVAGPDSAYITGANLTVDGGTNA